MKSKVFVFFAVAWAVSFVTAPAFADHIESRLDPALAGGTIIDFKDQTLGVYQTLTIGGVTFTAVDNHFRIDNQYQWYNQQGLYLDNGTYEDPGFGTLRIDFAGPISAFGFNWGMAEASWVLTTFDSSGNILETFNLPSTGPSNDGEFYGIAANVFFISYATLSWTGDYDWVAIDNFTYVTAVPEPATLLLIGIGLGGTALVGFRRKNR